MQPQETDHVHPRLSSSILHARLKYGHRVTKPVHDHRFWPDAVLTTAPAMLSTDLRDGNQALPDPMTFDRKLKLFRLLVSMGFKEIEVAMPCANQTEYDFARYLAQTPGLVPEDVSIQVITPCRNEAIARTVDSVRGLVNVIIFTFLASSDNYRQNILGLSQSEWIENARQATKYIRTLTKDAPDASVTRWVLNFGFEDYANARLEPVVKCAEAVKQTWAPTKDERMIFALASSVEVSTPNIFADQVEQFHQALSDRETWRLSVHTHNDRGGAVASAELAALAGADRVEGCLFGNGERAGNMDLVTFALNLFTQGIDTGLDLSRLDHIRKVYEDTTLMTVHPRTPYVGAYYLRAFSGMHQNAIIKGLEQRNADQHCQTPPVHGLNNSTWRVPYLPIDPEDIGRTMEDVIGINNQSGKTGVKWFVQTRTGDIISAQDAKALTKVMKERSSLVELDLSALQKICGGND